MLLMPKHEAWIRRDIQVRRAVGTTRIEGAALDEDAVRNLEGLGSGAKVTEDELANINALQAYEFIDFLSDQPDIPIDELAFFMNKANVLISTRTIGNNPPLKIYDYLGAGKPIVATNINAHTQILNDDIAVLVDPGPEFIAEGIISLIDNPSYAKILGKRSRDFFENNYSTQEKIERNRQILNVVMREDI